MLAPEWKCGLARPDTICSYDFAPLLAKETVLTLPLQNPEYFKAYFIELGAVCWENGLEFSAAAPHLELQSAGKLSRVEQAA